MPAEACERWLQYRDIRNASAHNYGERFAETALELIPAFVADARALADAIEGEVEAKTNSGIPGSRIWFLSLPDDENGPKFSSNSEGNRCLHLGATVLAGPDLGQWEAP